MRSRQPFDTLMEFKHSTLTHHRYRYSIGETDPAMVHWALHARPASPSTNPTPLLAREACEVHPDIEFVHVRRNPVSRALAMRPQVDVSDSIE
ncbi:Uncharacterized protein PBTT_00426 [Plasmodiophora brassicae]